MSAVSALEDLRERCFVEDESACWLWRGACDAGGTPMVRVKVGMSLLLRPGSQPARRVAWVLSEKALQAGWTVWRHLCDEPSCIAPHHSRAGTKSEWGAAMRASGRMRGDPRRSAAASRAALRNPATLPAAVVRQIEADLAAGTRREAVAERYGCGLGTISSINCRRHPHQRPGARGASVFHLT